MHQLLLFVSLGLTFSTPLTSALKIASALSTIEYTPELVANQDYYNNQAQIVNGGVPNLFSDSSVDLASNAETQALRNYAQHKDLRIIYTVAEVYYRIVANKKSGINSITDLKGKKIGTIPSTSAAYFVQKYLSSVGLKDSDYTIVSGGVCQSAPCGSGTLPNMLAQGSVDAVGIWEPSGELAAEAIGSNAIIFQNRTVYREVFNLHSTVSKLNDTNTRKDIVAFIKVLNQAQNVFTTDPQSIWSRVATAVSMNTTVLQAVWPIHSFNDTLPSDLLDVLVAEDQWVAQQDRRSTMSQADLTTLIDDSVLKEALQT